MTYKPPHHQRIVRGDGNRAVGFVRLTQGHFWRAYSYDAGMGLGPFPTEHSARLWVADASSDGRAA